MELIPQSEKGKARDQAGKIFNVSGRYIQQAKTIQKEKPEEFKKIKVSKKSWLTTLKQINK